MANAHYDLGREGILNDSFDCIADSIKVLLVGSGYSVDLATDEFVADVPSGEIIARSAALSAKTATGGVFNAATVAFASVPAGADGYFLVLYNDTGSDATSRLIGYIDTAGGLPVTPNGGTITISWDTTAGLKIFKL